MSKQTINLGDLAEDITVKIPGDDKDYKVHPITAVTFPLFREVDEGQRTETADGIAKSWELASQLVPDADPDA